MATRLRSTRSGKYASCFACNATARSGASGSVCFPPSLCLGMCWLTTRAPLEQKEEVERRRKMSDAEILAEDADKARKPKEKLAFLQRYYHKGAFYQDELKEKYSDEGDELDGASLRGLIVFCFFSV